MLDHSTRTIKVVIIEDQRRIREGLEALIGGTEGYSCSGAFRSMEEALSRPWTDIPDVALVDIGLPGMSGIEGLRLLREKYPSRMVRILSPLNSLRFPAYDWDNEQTCREYWIHSDSC